LHTFSLVASCSLAEGTRRARRPGQPPGESARSSADALREPHKLRRGRRDLLVGLGPAHALIRDLLVGPGACRSDVQRTAGPMTPTLYTFSLTHQLRTSSQVSTTRRLPVLSVDGANTPSVAAPPHAPLVQGVGSATGKAPLLTTRSTPRRRHQSGKRRPRHLWVLEAARARCERLHELRRGGQNRALAAPRRRHAQRTEARRPRECAQRRTEAPDLRADQPCTPHPAPTENESHAPKERRILGIRMLAMPPTRRPC
jgi:hypothetical protein